MLFSSVHLGFRSPLRSTFLRAVSEVCPRATSAGGLRGLLECGAGGHENPNRDSEEGEESEESEEFESDQGNESE